MTRPAKVAAALRVVTAGLAVAIAGIHLDLWASYGYRHIPTIGPLFLLNAVTGGLLALASLALPRRFLALVWVGIAGYAAATLGALFISLNATLFGFSETTAAPLLAPSIAVEVFTIVLEGAAGIGQFMTRRQPGQS